VSEKLSGVEMPSNNCWHPSYFFLIRHELTSLYVAKKEKYALCPRRVTTVQCAQSGYVNGRGRSCSAESTSHLNSIHFWPIMNLSTLYYW